MARRDERAQPLVNLPLPQSLKPRIGFLQ